MQYLIGLIGLLFGGLFFYRSKAKSAEAINQNIEVKEAVVKEDGSIAKNQGQVESAKADIEASKSQAATEMNKATTNEELITFINQFKRNNK